VLLSIVHQWIFISGILWHRLVDLRRSTTYITAMVDFPEATKLDIAPAQHPTGARLGDGGSAAHDRLKTLLLHDTIPVTVSVTATW